MKNVGLVLEGGGMRGVYTCGVMEYFMEKELYFKYVIGVSAGACNAASYISKQRGRNEKVIIGYINDSRYLSFRNLLRERSLFGMNFIFDEIPSKHVPFDFEEFNNSQCNFVIGATDCRTGRAVYFTKKDIDEKFHPLRASASLPMVSPIVNYKGYELLDGGIADSIPIAKAIEDGNDKNIIVLTRNRGYRKSPIKFEKVIKLKYRKYPELVNALINRYKKYNETLDLIEKLEREGKVLVIAPSKELSVDRYEKKPEKLRQLLREGYEDAAALYEKIIEFIEE